MSDIAIPPLGWTPPVIILDYGNKARVVTQADVDRWLKIERAHELLLDGILTHLPSERLRAHVDKLSKDVA